jgi:hypothetical protein
VSCSVLVPRIDSTENGSISYGTFKAIYVELYFRIFKNHILKSQKDLECLYVCPKFRGNIVIIFNLQKEMYQFKTGLFSFLESHNIV